MNKPGKGLGWDMSEKKVVLGMSGGVDSSVAALLLKEQGYEVLGVTMKLRPENGASGCGSMGEAEDAKKVARCLGISHEVVDFTEAFARKVISNFVSEYQAGRTPNPCVVCNRYIKFEALLQYALGIGADYIATGHYARVEKEKNGRWLLRCSPASKDQSYVLYKLTQEQLSHILMPLSSMEKPEARILAERYGLPVAHKPDSQEICFVDGKDYAGFIERYTGEPPVPGSFVDGNGMILGKHKGMIHYTVGQRKGLGVAFGKPMYVTRLCPENNTVVLGEEGSQYRQELFAGDLNWILFDQPPGEFEATAKVRYQAKPAKARVVSMPDGRVHVIFDTPQRSVTPGQAVVFYDGDIVIGGGTILR